MKYKCTDCGQEYDKKPEFCDCGNNVFTEVADGNIKAESANARLKSSPVQNSNVKPISKNSRRFDIPSLLFFILCLVLSVLSWIFIGRDIKPVENDIKENPAPVVKNIPSIDKLWHEKSPTSNVTVKTQVSEPTAVKVAEKKVFPKTVTSKKVEQPKKAAQITPKTSQNTQPQTVVQNPQPTMTEQEKQEIIQKLTTKKTPAKTQSAVVQPKPEPVITEVKQEIKPEVKAPDTAQLKKEYDAYKVELQNKLGKSINFGAVIGDGKCAITFKLDGTGNLVSRKFASQSQNNSLNDAVYAAMLANPTFREPPVGYNGETLTLYVSMYGGSFEVKLK